MTVTPLPPAPPSERKVAFLTLLSDDRPLHTLSFTLPAALVARIARYHELTDGAIELVIRAEDEHALSLLLEQQIDGMLPESEAEVGALLRERDAAVRLSEALGIDAPGRPEEVAALLHSEAADRAFESFSDQLAEHLGAEAYDPQSARPVTGRLLAFPPR